MSRIRPLVRVLLGVLIVASCLAAAVVPLLGPPAEAAPNPGAPALPGDIVIAAFRFVGAPPGNESNQYIELFNRSCTNTINLLAYSVWFSDGGGSSTELYSFTASTPLAPGHYYLLGGPGFDGTGAADSPDASYSPVVPSDKGGVVISSSADDTQPLDQVGFNQPDGYYEGTPLVKLTGTTDQSYVRKTVSGMYLDTNDNSQDFVLQNPSVPLNHTQTGTCGSPIPLITGNVQAPNATITYSANGGSNTVIADAAGNYSIPVSPTWTGTVTVTPSKTGFTFSPTKKTYTAPILSDRVGQDFAATRTSPGDRSVLINEVAWGGTRANATDQWIELYNPNVYGVDMSSMELIGTSGTLGTSGILTLSGILTDDVLPGHGFLVIEDNADVFQSLPASPYSYLGVTYTIATMVDSHMALSTYGERLILEGPDGQVDAADHLGYAWPAGRGGLSVVAANRASMERHDSDPDSSIAWYTFAGTAPIAVLDAGGFTVKGTPGEPNWANTVTATPSPTPTHYKTPTPRPPTPFAHMVLNEFLPRAGYDWNNDGKVDVYDEFVEIKNLGPINASLSGWKIDVISPGGPSSYIISSLTLQPGQRAIFYGLKTGLSLYDSGGTVRLISNRGIVIDARSYGPAVNPDQSICRIPDGLYWTFPCFPTPGNENTLTGSLPAPAPAVASLPAPCLLADVVPAPFKQAECYGFGADIFNPAYWDNQSGFQNFPVADVLSKHRAAVR